MFKIKHERTADVVVAEHPPPQERARRRFPAVGLYDDGGALQHVASAAFPMKQRAQLVEELEPLRMEDVERHPWAAWSQESAHESARLPGAPSRWSTKKDPPGVPLRPERVAEVAYDHMENGVRFRHTAASAAPAPGPDRGELYVQPVGRARRVRPHGDPRPAELTRSPAQPTCGPIGPTSGLIGLTRRTRTEVSGYGHR